MQELNCILLLSYELTLLKYNMCRTRILCNRKVGFVSCVQKSLLIHGIFSASAAEDALYICQ
jgi:hypothetical protein